jgi:hypothetical protein
MIAVHNRQQHESNNNQIKCKKEGRMKASELRIGNYVEFCSVGIPTGNTGQVEGGTIASFEECYIRLLPVPLTEEWLLKFGFERRNNWFRKGDFSYEDNKIYLSFGCHCEGPEETDIKYVHQLQNLYFALTGEEL